MYFSLKFLKSKIDEEDVAYFYFQRPAEACRTFRFWDRTSGAGERDSICFIPEKEFAEALRKKTELPSNLICIASEKSASDFCRDCEAYRKDSNILILRDIKSAAEWLNCLSTLMQKYAQMEERLIQALLNQAPLTDVLNIYEEILDNPVALYDAHLNLLGQSNLFEKGFVPNQYWMESALLQYVSADLLHRLKNSGVAEKLVKSKKAMLVDLKDGSEPYMTCNLFLNHDSEDVHVGSISLFAANHSICPEDAELLEQISASVAGRTEKEAQGHDLRMRSLCVDFGITTTPL